ncbi:MAG TPA: RNA polymerase sigma factor region1.1 domain-containing protein, partial [Polyangia bacterium]
MIEDADEPVNEDLDDEDAPPRLPPPAKRGAASSKETDKKKRELITMGKAKGFLTYDEINDHMPENIVSSDQIDDWLSTLGGEGIEVVDSASQAKAGEKAGPGIEVEEEAETAAKDEDAAEEKAQEEEEEDGFSKTNDPVRMYLRKMGSVSLLTREGEVEIAKRIEDGERRVLQVVLNCAVAIEEILDLGDKLRKQKVRVKDVVKDADEEDAEFDEQWHIERVCKVIDKVRKLHLQAQKVDEKVAGKVASEASKKKAKAEIADLKNEMFEALQELRMNKKQIDRIVARLKSYVTRIEAANREVTDAETRSGMSLREFRKTLREVKGSPVRQRAVEKKLGIRTDELEELAKVVANAQKKIKIVEEEAGLSEDVLRETVREVQDGEHNAEIAKAELVEANLR